MSWTLQDSAVTPYLSICRAAAQGSDFFKTFIICITGNGYNFFPFFTR